VPNSKLKVRADQAQHGSKSSTAPYSEQSNSTHRHSETIQSSARRAHNREPRFFYSLLKGIVLIALLFVGAYHSPNLASVFPFKKITEFFTPKTTGVSINQSDSSSTGNVASTKNAAPIAIPESTTEKTLDNVTPATQSNRSEPEDPQSIPKPEEPGTAGSETSTESKVSETDEIRIDKIDTNQSASSDEPAATEINSAADTKTTAIDSAVTNATEIPQTKTSETSTANPNYTVRTYKAKMFSDPNSADAIETPVSRGAEVMVLDRSGDWVKIEIKSSGETGYIHITQLSEN